MPSESHATGSASCVVTGRGGRRPLVPRAERPTPGRAEVGTVLTSRLPSVLSSRLQYLETDL